MNYKFTAQQPKPGNTVFMIKYTHNIIYIKYCTKSYLFLLINFLEPMDVNRRNKESNNDIIFYELEKIYMITWETVGTVKEWGFFS